MTEEQLRDDVDYLAHRLPHRGANTENERRAAEYLRDRFLKYTPHAYLDDFYSIDSSAYLFASYYVEFLIVALLATWSPWVGLVYGLVVFLLYMAEFTGFPLVARLLPQYETQNVVAKFMSAEPTRTVIVTAHYDSPKATILTDPRRVHRLRWVQILIVSCMVAILATCIADGMGVFAEWDNRPDQWLRWAAVGLLLGCALMLHVGETHSEFTRGAANNAAGVAVLLGIAESLSEKPLEHTDVMLVSTGSKENWLSGMHHVLKQLEVDRDNTYFLNVDHVGGGKLHYVTGEGMLHVYRSDAELVKLAKEEGRRMGATPLRYRGLPTDGLAPMVRGYKTLSIMATGEDELPVHYNWLTDTAPAVDLKVAAQAGELAETIVRRLDAQRV